MPLQCGVGPAVGPAPSFESVSCAADESAHPTFQMAGRHSHDERSLFDAVQEHAAPIAECTADKVLLFSCIQGVCNGTVPHMASKHHAPESNAAVEATKFDLSLESGNGFQEQCVCADAPGLLQNMTWCVFS